MPARMLSDFLDKNDVNYHAYNHAPAVTASEVAQSAHIPGAQLAKTVIVSGDGKLAMAVVPAHRMIDYDCLRALMDVESLMLAKEEEFRGRFPDCEVGGMPPLGNMYDMKVYMDKSLLKQDWIAFNAGNHTEIIKMDTGVLKRLIRPVMGAFSQVPELTTS